MLVCAIPGCGKGGRDGVKGARRGGDGEAQAKAHDGGGMRVCSRVLCVAARGSGKLDGSEAILGLGR